MTRLSSLVLEETKGHPSPDHYYQNVVSRIAAIDGLTTLYAHNIGLNWQDPYLQEEGHHAPVKIQKAFPPSLHQILDSEIITFSEQKSGDYPSLEVIDDRLRKHLANEVRDEAIRVSHPNAFYVSEFQRNTLGWCFVLSMYVIDQKKQDRE